MSITRNNSTLNTTATYCRPVALSLDRALLDEGIVRGYAARFGEGFAPGAFKASLDTWRACGTLPHLTWNGDPSEVIGKLTSALEDATGLLVTGKVALGTSRGSTVQQQLRSGVDGMSAFFVEKTKVAKTCTEVQLTEISIMHQAAIPSGKDAPALKFEDSRQFEGWLRDQGVAKAAARKLATGGWSKLAAGDEDTHDAANLEALIKTLGLANFDLSDRR